MVSFITIRQTLLGVDIVHYETEKYAWNNWNIKGFKLGLEGFVLAQSAKGRERLDMHFSTSFTVTGLHLTFYKDLSNLGIEIL